MEKLTPKHNHTLTDILKVGIFGIILLLPFMIFAPSLLYFGFNEQANAPTKQEEIKETINVNFNQLNANTNTEFNISGWRTDSIWSNPLLYYNSNYDFTNNVGHILIGYSELNQPDISIAFTNNSQTINTRFTLTSSMLTSSNHTIACAFRRANTSITYTGSINASVNFYDLTIMYGEGNEPTQTEFYNMLENRIYPYTEIQQLLIERTIGTETFVDITTQINYNWQQIWNMPILSWTKYTILMNGIKAFTGVFGIVDTCYITNLITYELIMVAIYIVIDIVLKMFEWLTHMIVNK